MPLLFQFRRLGFDVPRRLSGVCFPVVRGKDLLVNILWQRFLSVLLDAPLLFYFWYNWVVAPWLDFNG